MDQNSNVKPDRLILEAFKPVPSGVSLASLHATRTDKNKFQLPLKPADVIDKKLHFHANFTPDSIGTLSLILHCMRIDRVNNLSS